MRYSWCQVSVHLGNSTSIQVWWRCLAGRVEGIKPFKRRFFFGWPVTLWCVELDIWHIYDIYMTYIYIWYTYNIYIWHHINTGMMSVCVWIYPQRTILMRKQMIKNSIFARPYSQTNLYNGSDFPTNTKTRSGASAASVFVDCPSLMFVSSWDEGFF